MAERSLGWKRQTPDDRDFKFETPRRMTATLASKIDLTPNMGEYFDQGSLGSCGPNTAAECIEYDQKVQTYKVLAASRLFIYYNTRALMGPQYVNQDSGVDNRTMLKAMAQYGFCSEAMWPYDVSKFTLKPPAACYQAAVANQINNYAAVQKTMPQMKGCNAQGLPFIFGFDVFQSMMTDEVAATGIIQDPQPGQTPIGGHDMTICGYDDAGFGKIPGGAFKLRQHWVNSDGSKWGDGGYAYMSYSYASGPNASDFWVINAVPGTPVTPPKPPTPPNPPGPIPDPIPPSPGGPTAAQIVTTLDAEFKRLKTLNPMLAQLLTQLNVDLDAVIGRNFKLEM